MGYVESDRFTTLRADTKKLRADLAAVRYCLRIQGNRIDVRLLGSERDYAEDVERTFERLKRGSTKDYTVDIPDRPGMNHVEEGILDLVAQLYPDVFSALDEFCGKYRRCLEEIIRRFDREIQFYVAYLDHIARFKKAGLAFCYPEYSHESREIRVSEGYDLALADRLLAENGTVVCNDFGLKGNERVLVVTGPNQGGKTTFARAFGQIHHLASLGCPVPAREAKLAPFDKLFTHFEKEETRSNLRGKLQDDLLRMRDILSRASSASVVIINEILSSTTLHDALFLGLKLMERIVRLGPMCVYVTFIDELATYSEETVSMVGAVVPDHPDVRTYKIQRRPPDGLSHALSLAAKRRLTYTLLKERLLP
jgi:DNA mismatch repair ATPase MutS